MAGKWEENQQWGNVSTSCSLYRVHLCSRREVREETLPVIVLGKQESFVKPRTEGEFIYGFLFHQVPSPSKQQRN